MWCLFWILSSEYVVLWFSFWRLYSSFVFWIPNADLMMISWLDTDFMTLCWLFLDISREFYYLILNLEKSGPDVLKLSLSFFLYWSDMSIYPNQNNNRTLELTRLLLCHLVTCLCTVCVTYKEIFHWQNDLFLPLLITRQHLYSPWSKTHTHKKRLYFMET